MQWLFIGTRRNSIKYFTPHTDTCSLSRAKLLLLRLYSTRFGSRTLPHLCWYSFLLCLQLVLHTQIFNLSFCKLNLILLITSCNYCYTISWLIYSRGILKLDTPYFSVCSMCSGHWLRETHKSHAQQSEGHTNWSQISTWKGEASSGRSHTNASFAEKWK